MAFIHKRAVVDSKRLVGKGTRIWGWVHVMKGVPIGKDCNIGEHCFIETDAVIGDRVTIKNGVSVWEKVTLEDDVFIGPNVAFTNDRYPTSEKRGNLLPTLIKKGAAIGANSTILCGITIGKNALVGAGSVVTKSVPDNALVYGNPARQHKRKIKKTKYYA